MKRNSAWLYDETQSILYGDGRETRLTAKAGMVLACLVRHHGFLVRHETIASEVWPGLAIRPDIVREYVSDLRKAMNDDARCPKVIETVRGKGYRLTVEVEISSESRGRTAIGSLAQLDLLADTIATGALMQHCHAPEVDNAPDRVIEVSFLTGSVHLAEGRLRAVLRFVLADSGQVRTRQYEWPAAEPTRLRDAAVGGSRDAGDDDVRPAFSILSHFRAGSRSDPRRLSGRAAYWPVAA